jgi:hypothetical protein
LVILLADGDIGKTPRSEEVLGYIRLSDLERIP